MVPVPGAGSSGGACVSGVPAGSILWVKRVSSAVRLRFSPDAAGQTLGRVLRGRVLGWYEARARRESPPGGNWLGPSRGWDGGRLPRAAGWRTQLLRGLSVREVSFGGVWPGSRIRRDEGGHSGRFRLGRLGRVQSRRDDVLTAPSVMAVRTSAWVFARSMSSWCVAGSGPSCAGPGQQLAAHPVQLADVAQPEAAQEGAQSLPSRKRGVEGALAVKPRARAVLPVRNAPASSMQSPPASAEATRVIILSPVLARPRASPRSRRCCTN